jgi:hypothetical protein
MNSRSKARFVAAFVAIVAGGSTVLGGSSADAAKRPSPTTTTTTTAPPVTVPSDTTPPSVPQNVRFFRYVDFTLANGTVVHYADLEWDASTDNASAQTQLSYTYRQDGVSKGLTCSQYCFGATSLRIVRPAAGTSFSISVSALDYAGNTSAPSAPFVLVG